uniref:ATP-dependent Clp protease proteolytic subunit n=1 Tax=Shehbazia tibetica TaxID=282604 RepID=A0A6M8ZLT1_9BRAS|nr:ATP-dependent protease subunit [Shehbazia tibetica]
MPVGVPKVLLIISSEDEEEDDEISWVDVYNRLYRERFVFLGQETDTETTNNVVGLMVFLGLDDSTIDINLYINSPGGGALNGIALFDGMHYVDPNVHTICIGIAASTASFVLIGGKYNKRLAYPHARVMIHQPACSFFESPSGEFYLETYEILRIRTAISEVYIKETGQPAWVIYDDMERDVFMSATEAQAHGIVDHVGVNFVDHVEVNNKNKVDDDDVEVNNKKVDHVGVNKKKS